jgi:hypothetical protein
MHFAKLDDSPMFRKQVLSLSLSLSLCMLWLIILNLYTRKENFPKVCLVAGENYKEKWNFENFRLIRG